MDYIWRRIQKLDERITREEPYKLVKKNPELGQKIITELAEELYWIGRMLFPFMPETNASIKAIVKENKMPKPLFVRKQ